MEQLLNELKRRPHDFKIIERVPFTLDMGYPYELDCNAGDETVLHS